MICHIMITIANLTSCLRLRRNAGKRGRTGCAVHPVNGLGCVHRRKVSNMGCPQIQRLQSKNNTGQCNDMFFLLSPQPGFLVWSTPAMLPRGTSLRMSLLKLSVPPAGQGAWHWHNASWHDMTLTLFSAKVLFVSWQNHDVVSATSGRTAASRIQENPLENNLNTEVIAVSSWATSCSGSSWLSRYSCPQFLSLIHAPSRAGVPAWVSIHEVCATNTIRKEWRGCEQDAMKRLASWPSHFSNSLQTLWNECHPPSPMRAQTRCIRGFAWLVRPVPTLELVINWGCWWLLFACLWQCHAGLMPSCGSNSSHVMLYLM